MFCVKLDTSNPRPIALSAADRLRIPKTANKPEISPQNRLPKINTIVTGNNINSRQIIIRNKFFVHIKFKRAIQNIKI